MAREVVCDIHESRSTNWETVPWQKQCLLCAIMDDDSVSFGRISYFPSLPLEMKGDFYKPHSHWPQKLIWKGAAQQLCSPVAVTVNLWLALVLILMCQNESNTSTAVFWNSSVIARSVILETQVPGGLREVGDCLAWKDHEVRLDREACRENRVPRGCLAAKVQL